MKPVNKNISMAEKEAAEKIMSDSNGGTLFGALHSYGESDMLPMHMPGHKRNTSDPVLNALGAGYDITEVHGFDDLHHPKGILLEISKRAASLWGSMESRLLVGGSTVGILSAVYAACTDGCKIIMARNCHRSVYGAVELCGSEPVYVMPDCKENLPVNGSVDPVSVKNAIAENPDAALVVITSPTYEGVISDVAEIADVCHKAGIPLLVDEAHGAHLGLYGVFPDGAVTSGADIVVQSLHKTLQSLTQTGVMHICSDRVSTENIDAALDIFQTSSPSYLLMASIDNCIKLADKKCLETWRRNLYSIVEDFSALENLSVLNIRDFYNLDPSKITLLTERVNITGARLSGLLRSEYHIETEMCAGEYIVAMTGAGDTADSLSRFSKAVLDIDRKISARNARDRSFNVRNTKRYVLPRRVMSVRQAKAAKTVLTDAESAIGSVCAEYVYAYPPGIPVLVPGEQIDVSTVKLLADMSTNGVELHSRTGQAPVRFLTVI